MLNTKNKELTAYILIFSIFGGFLAWWLFNFFTKTPGDRSFELYSDTYWVLALIGAVYGYFGAKQWGGFSSIFGKALIFFSAGLFAQVFGQVAYTSIALIKGIEAPYPSIGDIGFFGSIIFYILGMLFLSKALGVRFGLASTKNRITAILIPLILLGVSYAVFLKGYEFTDNRLITFLDFGYPLGQAIYVSLALLAYILSSKLLGGRMKGKILLLLFALTVQYFADFLYLYRFSKDQIQTGYVSDLIYQFSYLLMAVALIRIAGVARRLSAKQNIDTTQDKTRTSGASNG